jgi:hypothetical protein
MKHVALLLCLLAACDSIPRDPDGTLERIRASGEFRAGLIADGDERQLRAPAERLLARIGQRTGAAARVERGSAAQLLPRLEAGELDIVLGRFDRPSPWKRRVALSAPIAELRLPPDPQDLRAAMPHGENAWIGLVETEAHAIAKAQG